MQPLAMHLLCALFPPLVARPREREREGGRERERASEREQEREPLREESLGERESRGRVRERK